MKKTYRVAGHLFRVEHDMEGLWKAMSNYAPFQIEESDEEPLFTVRVVDALPDGEASVFVKDEPEEPDMPRIDIYSQAGGWLFDMYPIARSGKSYKLWTTHDFRHGQLLRWNTSECGRFPLDNAAMVQFAMCTAMLGTLEIHASVIVNSGRAYLFLGKSGTGKSTHSSLWLKNIPGSHLMNDDNPIVRILPNGSAIAYGSPWSGKTPCYKNESAQIGAFVQLRQCKENKIARQQVLEAYSSLYDSSSGLMKLTDIAEGIDDTIFKIIDKVPFWLLDCLPDADAALLCSKTCSTT